MNTRFLSTTPILIVNDVVQARNFYFEKLGFEHSFQWGDPVVYAGVKRGEVEIHLNSAFNAQNEAGKGSVFILTNEVDQLCDQYMLRGVEIYIEPADRDYGLRDFGIRDPDGNIINFGCEISESTGL